MLTQIAVCQNTSYSQEKKEKKTHFVASLSSGHRILIYVKCFEDGGVNFSAFIFDLSIFAVKLEISQV